MRTITLEEHFATPDFINGPGHALKSRSGMERVIEQLCDLGDQRIADMDAAGIDLQVVSLNSPGVEQLDANQVIALSISANDYLADAVRRYPTRLAGFAALPTPNPEAAARELERAVGELGFKGTVINGHVRGRYLDDPFFWPILERAEVLQAPIYLHPVQPPRPVVEASFTGNFSPEVAYALSTAAWGWHIETATHILRIILSGAFDRFPRLQFIIGHMGEGLPFFLPRTDQHLQPQVTKLKRPIRAYLRENVYYTFSGFNYMNMFNDLMSNTGVDRVMFSADYPYSSMEKARAFLEQLPISDADRERIAHGNAEKLLKM